MIQHESVRLFWSEEKAGIQVTQFKLQLQSALMAYELQTMAAYGHVLIPPQGLIFSGPMSFTSSSKGGWEGDNSGVSDQAVLQRYFEVGEHHLSLKQTTEPTVHL